MQARFESDEEYKAQGMAMIAKTFAEADVNNNGLLNHVEMTNWC